MKLQVSRRNRPIKCQRYASHISPSIFNHQSSTINLQPSIVELVREESMICPPFPQTQPVGSNNHYKSNKPRSVVVNALGIVQMSISASGLSPVPINSTLSCWFDRAHRLSGRTRTVLYSLFALSQSQALNVAVVSRMRDVSLV